MAQQPTSSALRALALEFKSLQEEPVEGKFLGLGLEKFFSSFQSIVISPNLHHLKSRNSI